MTSFIFSGFFGQNWQQAWVTSTKEKHASMFMSIIINCLESLLSRSISNILCYLFVPIATLWKMEKAGVQYR